MGNSIFKLVYFLEMVLISVVRSIGTSKYRKLTTEVDRTTLPDQILLGLNGIAMILPIFSCRLGCAGSGWCYLPGQQFYSGKLTGI